MCLRYPRGDLRDNLFSRKTEVVVQRFDRGRCAERIDAEVRALIDAAHDEAWKVLTANRPILDQLAKELLEKETLDHNQLEKIFAKVKKLPARPVWKSNPKRPVSTKGPIAVPKRASIDTPDATPTKSVAKSAAKPVAKRTKPAAK